MKDRKEEILEKRIVLFPGTPDMPSDRIKHNVLLAMEQYAMDRAVRFAEWCAWNRYYHVGGDMWSFLTNNNLGSASTEQLYQQYLESIPQPSK